MVLLDTLSVAFSSWRRDIVYNADLRLHHQSVVTSLFIQSVIILASPSSDSVGEEEGKEEEAVKKYKSGTSKGVKSYNFLFYLTAAVVLCTEGKRGTYSTTQPKINFSSPPT